MLMSIFVLILLLWYLRVLSTKLSKYIFKRFFMLNGLFHEKTTIVLWFRIRVRFQFRPSNFRMNLIIFVENVRHRDSFVNILSENKTVFKISIYFSILHDYTSTFYLTRYLFHSSIIAPESERFLFEIFVKLSNT